MTKGVRASEHGTVEGETRTNTSIKRRRSNLSNRSINCSNYVSNPGGKAKKRRPNVVRNLVSNDKMNVPSILEGSVNEEDSNPDSRPNSSTPIKDSRRDTSAGEEVAAAKENCKNHDFHQG